MSKYFIPFVQDEKEDPTNPEDIQYIREELVNYGMVECDNQKLGELWRKFSMDDYQVHFLNPRLNTTDIIKEFAGWLYNYNEEDK